jgi:hypothetical protein
MRIICFFLSCYACFLQISVYAQTNLVKINANGQLSYFPDPDGFVLPDFSYAGYHNGIREIPSAIVVKEISPVSGDNTAHIQSAIDEVGNLPVNAAGLRGAVLLKAGKYEINGTIKVDKSGIILRGEGNGASISNSTLLSAKGNSPAQRDVVILGNSSSNKWTTKISNSQQNIIDDIVPVGAMSFSVASAMPYQVGDLIAIYHPCSENWLAAINYGGVPQSAVDEQWTVNQYPIIFHRYITAISNNQISIDAPVFYTLNKSLSQSYIYKIGGTISLQEIGIENLRIEIDSQGGTDEEHAWQSIRFRSVENCWAKNVVTKGFGQSGFITESCTRTTIEDCEAIDPVSQIEGERRYNFNTYIHSQLILFKNCYAREGRHNYVSNGTSTVSGIVFLNCISEGVYNVNEGHRHWTQGMLFDGHQEVNLNNRTNKFVLGLYNRMDNGTGHGWSAVQSVLWNCDVTKNGIIGLQKPPTSQNYAIGCTADKITGKLISSTDFPIGYVEAKDSPVSEIPSLYIAQLNDRKNREGMSTEILKQSVSGAIVVSTQYFLLSGMQVLQPPLSEFYIQKKIYNNGCVETSKQIIIKE